nr:MAG TPA: hypothetical protein [Caudoviricetes sp.]
MFRLHQPEREFWKNMTPHRLDVLLEALEPTKKQQPQSLAAYLSGGT